MVQAFSAAWSRPLWLRCIEGTAEAAKRRFDYLLPVRSATAGAFAERKAFRTHVEPTMHGDDEEKTHHASVTGVTRSEALLDVVTDNHGSPGPVQ